MTKSTDQPTKQSRRRFAKAIATALAAAPAIVALSSCRPGTNDNNDNGAHRNPSPSPPSPSPTAKPINTAMFDANEPPIIVDGGSCEITTLVEFTPKGPKDHFGLPAGQTIYKGVKGAMIMNDYGVVKEYPVSAAQTLTVKIWFAAVKRISGDDVDFDPLETDPQFVLTANGAGTNFDLFVDDGLGTKKKNFKGKKLGQEYLIEKWKSGVKDFRLGQAQILVDGVGDMYNKPDQGIRIVIGFNP